MAGENPEMTLSNLLHRHFPIWFTYLYGHFRFYSFIL